MISKKLLYIVLLVVIVGIGARIASIYFNLPYPHGNWLYINVAQSLVERGDMQVSTVDPRYQFFPVHTHSMVEKGGEHLDHNPAWPIMAAGVMKVSGLDSQRAFVALSFVAGLGVLVLLYMVGSLLIDWRLGLFASTLAVFSYLLIDFSANGSFYILQVFLYLLFLYVLFQSQSKYKPVFLGIIAGVGMLVVHLSVALIGAYVLYLLFFERKNVRRSVINFVVFLAVVVVMYLPWGISNLLFFGDFFPPADSYIFGEKLGWPRVSRGDAISYVIGFQELLSLLKIEITNWFPKNLYFINRQLFVLAPLVYISSLFMMVETVFVKKFLKISMDEVRKLAPIIFILGLHIGIVALFPVPKFRHFVPMLPLILLLGGYYIFRFFPSSIARRWLVAVSIFLMIGFSVLTFLGSPTRTYFTGGVLTTDPFGEKWYEHYDGYHRPLIRDPKL